jgi:hypothetical protein
VCRQVHVCTGVHTTCMYVCVCVFVRRCVYVGVREQLAESTTLACLCGSSSRLIVLVCVCDSSIRSPFAEFSKMMITPYTPEKHC